MLSTPSSLCHTLSQRAQRRRRILCIDRKAYCPRSFFPHVIEPALGLDRLVYALLADAYVHAPVELRPGAKLDARADSEDEVEGRSMRKPSCSLGADRTTLRLDPGVAPYQFAVLPLLKKPPLVEKAAQVFQTLLGHGRATTDSAASIGRRYRRQDEIGTPYCITVDHASLQVRVHLACQGMLTRSAEWHGHDT
jgi:glycyl-tRNA synthetase